ncbi:hypothetical protein V8F06_013821 [Rhypophila decipiens]
MPRASSSSFWDITPTMTKDVGSMSGHHPIEPLTGAPDYLSVTWLASKLQLYGSNHPSSTAIKPAAFLGRGATFTVYRSRPYRGVVWAVKQPRLVFEYRKGESHTMRQLYALHMELRVLTDECIHTHGNIAKLVSVSWEEHADNPGQLWPSLVMEYADMGTLSACYRRGLKVTVQHQMALCFAIGDALWHLHVNGIIHGDIKPDNVLMFRDKSTQSFIPKLTDFGYSVFDGDTAPMLPKATPDWEAPELLQGKPVTDTMALSDVYSFGLLVWYVALGRTEPFESVAEVPGPFDGKAARESIRKLKLTTSIIKKATRSLESEAGTSSIYEPVFKLTLGMSPASRNLQEALSHLNPKARTCSESDRPPSATAQDTRNTLRTGQFSLRELRHLGTGIQAQILDSLESRAKATSAAPQLANDDQRAVSAYALAQCCLESMGRRSPSESVNWLILAAKLGHTVAKVVVCRVATSLGWPECRRQEIMAFLKQSAEEGFITAISDLSASDKATSQNILERLWAERRQHYTGSPTAESDLSQWVESLRISDDDGSLLRDAARCGDLPLVDKLLQIRDGDLAFLNSQDAQGQTALLKASMSGDGATVRFLLRSGADASIPDRRGETPLHWVFFFDNDSSVQDLTTEMIQRGGNIHAQTTTEWWSETSFRELPMGTALHRAAAWNTVNATKALLECGADPLLPSKRHELTTPLWLSCTFHSGESLLAMLTHLKSQGRLDPSTVLNGKWPLLMPVLDQGYYYRLGGTLGRIARQGPSFRAATYTTIDALAQHGANMILPGGTPITSQAILLRSPDILASVLTLAPPEMKEHLDATRKQPPLHFAVQRDRADLVELLLSHGAVASSRDSRGLTALATYANYHSGLNIPRILLGKGLTFETPTNGSQTPFFGAITGASFDLARFILQHTAPVERHAMINAPATWGPNFTDDPPGTTVLGYVLSDLHPGTPRVLERLFGVVESFDETVEFTVSPGEGVTALHILAGFEKEDRIDGVVAGVARQVLTRCRDVQVDGRRSKDGRTALAMAVGVGNYDLCCVLLLEAGADPSLGDGDGVSALCELRRLISGKGDGLGTITAGSGSREMDEAGQGKEEEVISGDEAVQQIKRLFEGRGYMVEEEHSGSE